MALQQSMTRASYCCAETDVELIVVPKDACVESKLFTLCGRHLTSRVRYTRLIKKFRDDETAARVDFLSKSVYLFDVWARDRINRIALHMQARCYTPAQKCLLQGQEPEGLLFLFRGSVKVFRSPVTYMSKAEATLRQRMSVGGMLHAAENPCGGSA
jgi:CRP-like cAMP-binding protein